mmetsp:Transcript_25663/g.42207  ORF Transcript_25663/g.42207 Transcript_25663/m.42207 type:complete len:209 (+) Transcript_25663:531-1157(+)
MRIGHGVEGTNGQWELVEDVKVGVILVFHKLAQLALLGSREIVIIPNLHPCGTQHGNTVLELDAERGLEELEWFERELELYGLQLLSKPLLEVFKDVHEEPIKDVQNLRVMLLYCHLKIETHKLGQMPMCVGVLCTEHWRNLEHTLKVPAHGHLLVQLRGLGQTRVPLEIFEPEDCRTALTSSSNELGCVDFHKVVGKEELSEKSAHG